LPLSFDPGQVSTPGTGQYSVEASAAGYLTQSEASVDITSSDQANIDFTLVQ
jgi:hypothetical protein